MKPALCHHASTFAVESHGRGTIDITRKIDQVVAESGASDGLCHVFVHHTSASLILCENADPTVREDLERFAARLVPDGDPLFAHVDEGDDDMPAHVRSILTQSAIAIPIAGAHLALGTWQGVYLWEHRKAPHRRTITVSIIGR
ncbi:MAG TPA: secondary thiamine-phosphate synthase enzyme YjbQ [Kofleriaceae bacterium]|nr:secondary thiamine-phosphate synthase enzyme YjbQ [Kofleriaceae bacterium]